MPSPSIRRALISASDKLGLADFARGLSRASVKIYSTGGTRSFLAEEGLSVEDVSNYTGFPELMDGRLKTLHPKVFGGILCRHDRSDDLESIEEYAIVPFELVVVNLYPFEATILREGVSEAEAIEQVDIGGPSLIRAAAKNHRFVTVATRPEQYSAILDQIVENRSTTLELRRRLAAEAFARTASYDRAIADYFAGRLAEGDFASSLNLVLHRKAVLRYGENPHQSAAVYGEERASGASMISARQLHGKELSYNNLLDLDSALAIARSFSEPAAVVIKHTNPCGAAVGDTLVEAAERALAGDPISAFGSVLGFNRAVDATTAELLARPGLFVEAVVAPEFEEAALDILTTKPKWKSNVRLMQVGRLDEPPSPRQFRFLERGLLVQDADSAPEPRESWRVVTRTRPDESQLLELQFGIALVRHVKSNAIVLSRDRAVCGVGAGQMSRVDAVEIAIRKAGERARGAVLSSDAFFPFPDSIESAAAAGVAAIVQPGGSKGDADVIAACDRHGIPMVFTGQRHFKH